MTIAMGAAGRECRARKRILVVDDHPMMRERLREVIESQPDLMVCGEADDQQPALQAVAATHPDAVIVDLLLRTSDGLDLIKDLRIRHPAVSILVFSMHSEVLHGERAIRAGARGYINKQEPAEKVLQALRTVLAGQIFLSPVLLSRLADKVLGRPRPSGTVEALTDRELRVFELLGQGHSTRQIANLLRLDMRTIETYRARIKDKLRLAGASELVQQAIRWVESGGRHL